MITIWPEGFFWKILQHLFNNTRGWGIVIGFFAWTVGLIPTLITIPLQIMGEYMATIAVESLSNVDFSTLESVAYVNAFFPLTEFIYLVGVYVTAWVVVIIVRWIKSLIPTVSN